jgi:hypothetical protein
VLKALLKPSAFRAEALPFDYAAHFPSHWRGRVIVKMHARAKRLCLRVDITKGRIYATHPKRAKPQIILAFILKNQKWLDDRLRGLITPSYLKAGDELSILGEKCVIAHHAGRKNYREGHCLYIGGEDFMLHARVKRFLKDEAEKIITEIVAAKAAEYSLNYRAIRIVDTKTRWGSCKSDGTLSFSWRLILTAPDILDYVVAHELAHLKHMDHSPAFWAECQRLCASGVIAPHARAWLKNNASALHRIA